MEEIRASVPIQVPPRPPSTDKEEREANGTCANSQSSENFVLKWGNNDSVSSTAVNEMLQAFEFSWAQEIGRMGHTAPVGTEQYKFNVYVGDTGSCAPSVYGMGGYFTVDSQGHPFIVMSQGTMADTIYGQSVAAHEFYHAVQHASDAYGTSDADWYWEATATWVEREVYVSDTVYAQFIFGYAFMPHKQLNAFDYPDSGAIEEYHQYGAFIFPQYLSEHEADWTLIRDSWVEADWYTDPVELLQELYPDRSLEAVFADFAAHNATWDYLDGYLYEQILEYTADETAFGIYDRRVVDTVGSQGTGEEWVDGSPETLPERYGYNVIRLKSPESRKLTVRFQGDPAGTDGSTARYQVRLVREFGTNRTYTEVPIEGVEGTLDVGQVGTEAALYLVVSAFSDQWNTGETFGYRYQMDMGEVDNPGVDTSTGGAKPQALHVGSDEPSACGCVQGRGAGGLWLAGLGLGLALRRRRPIAG